MWRGAGPQGQALPPAVCVLKSSPQQHVHMQTHAHYNGEQSGDPELCTMHGFGLCTNLYVDILYMHTFIAEVQLLGYTVFHSPPPMTILHLHVLACVNNATKMSY